MRRAQVLSIVDHLSTDYWALSALSVSLETGLLAGLLLPRDLNSAAILSGLPEDVTQGVLEVLLKLGLVARRNRLWVTVKSLQPLLGGAILPVWRAQLRNTVLSAWEFTTSALPGCEGHGGTVWRTDLIQSRALLSAAATHFAFATTYRRLPDLVAGLCRRGAKFLDVGAGACGADIVLARHFPHLQIVALEPNPVARHLARRNIEKARLISRIEIRRCVAENLRQYRQFDAAYIAQAFLVDNSLDRSLIAVRTALKPGGHLLTTALKAKNSTLSEAVAGLQRESWGGGTRLAKDMVDRLTQARFVDARIFNGDKGEVHVVARRAV